MAYAFDVENASMWVGFMSKYYVDDLPPQVVRYSPSMRQLTTYHGPWCHPGNTSCSIVPKNADNHIVVIDYLIAAKPTMQMQANEKPKYDMFFVEMAFFKALGKLIEDSGGTAMLTRLVSLPQDPWMVSSATSISTDARNYIPYSGLHWEFFMADHQGRRNCWAATFTRQTWPKQSDLIH